MLSEELGLQKLLEGREGRTDNVVAKKEVIIYLKTALTGEKIEVRSVQKELNQQLRIARKRQKNIIIVIT